MTDSGPGGLDGRSARLRLATGLLCGAAAVALSAWAVLEAFPRAWRLPVFPLLFLGVLGVLQSAART